MYSLITSIFASCANGQSSIAYVYDASGNRVTRSLSVELLKNGTVTTPLAEDLTDKNEDKSFLEEEPAINIYPNPTKGKILVEFKNYDISTTGNYLVFNLNGKTLRRADINVPQTEIDLSDISDGMYILRISVGEAVYNYKLIKQN